MVKKLFKMVVNVEKLLKMVENGDFSKFVKKGELLKNVGENIKKNFCAGLLLHDTSNIQSVLWILEILFLTTRSFTNIFCHLIITLLQVYTNSTSQILKYAAK